MGRDKCNDNDVKWLEKHGFKHDEDNVVWQMGDMEEGIGVILYRTLIFHQRLDIKKNHWTCNLKLNNTFCDGLLLRLEAWGASAQEAYENGRKKWKSINIPNWKLADMLDELEASVPSKDANIQWLNDNGFKQEGENCWRKAYDPIFENVWLHCKDVWEANIARFYNHDGTLAIRCSALGKTAEEAINAALGLLCVHGKQEQGE